MRSMNILTITLIFYLTTLQSTQCSASQAQTSNSPLNAVPWFYLAAPALTMATSVFGYYWWKNQSDLNEDQGRVKNVREVPKIKAALITSLRAKEKNEESIRNLQRVNQTFNPDLTQPDEDKVIEELYETHLKSDKPNATESFAQGFDKLVVHGRIAQFKEEYANRKMARNLAVAGTGIGLVSIITLGALKLFRKI